MGKSRCLGTKAQAAALDLGVFVAICVLALSFLFIQSARSAGSTGFIEENENINEVAIRAINALAQSSVEVEIKTVQTAAFKEISSCLSDDIRTVMSYADRILEELEDLEEYDAESDPFFIYLQARIDDISSYLTQSDGLVDAAVQVFTDSSEEAQVICDALGVLSTIMPGYRDLDMSCGGLASDLLNSISGNLSFASDALSELKSYISGGLDSLDLEKIREIRCLITAARDSANQFLGYLETGVDPGVSFMELLPVSANIDRLTVEKLLADAIESKNSFIFGDDMRSLAGGAALLFARGEDLGEHLPEVGQSGGQETVNGQQSSLEYIKMLPEAPLSSLTETTAEAPYHEMSFEPQAYLTPSGSLAIRLVVSGDFGAKQKTEYFESAGYILNSSAYPSSQHYRTYNGSSVRALVTESQVAITERSITNSSELTPEIRSDSESKEILILRPMSAGLSFVYENLTWPEEDYGFGIEHYCVLTNSNYTVNTSSRDCSKYNESDAEKSILFGLISAGRGSLLGTAEAAVKERLGELLEGYEYKFEVMDCCGVVLSINADKEPEGREGTVKRFFNAGRERAEMRLTVWRG